jgi:hypothetical protein
MGAAASATAVAAAAAAASAAAAAANAAAPFGVAAVSPAASGGGAVRRRQPRTRVPAEDLACPHEDCAFHGVSKSKLDRHLRTHTGERPYHCLVPQCTYRSSQKIDVVKHQKSKACAGKGEGMAYGVGYSGEPLAGAAAGGGGGGGSQAAGARAPRRAAGDPYYPSLGGAAAAAAADAQDF